MATINNNSVIAPETRHKAVNPRSFDDIAAIVDTIHKTVGERSMNVEIGIICGSGLGPIADKIDNRYELAYEKIPGFPQTHVIGHKGTMVFGTINGRSVCCLQGRFHPYEHFMDLALCTLPVRVFQQLGIKLMIVSNAAGGINSKFQHGDLMLIKDHIFLPGLAGFSPLVGINDPRFGPRFVSVHDAYDRPLRQLAMQLAQEQNMRLHEGIYVMSGGPQYESPAEVQLFKTVGADALGMSTAHEVTVARQAGIKVFGFSLITNIANLDADNSVEVSHAEVLEAAQEGGQKASDFVKQFIGRLPETI